MTLVKSNNMTPVFNRLFDDFFNNDWADWGLRNFSGEGSTLPKVNIKEDDNGYTVEMAAPGMKKEDFNVNLDKQVLTISAEAKEEKEEKKANYSRKEFNYQSFQRSFSLPETADDEKISAQYKDGILNIYIPKKEEAKPKPAKTIAIA
ncbi:MAG: Hsp20 family protein [Hydrotalea flava]|uniref:Hsp20/alpha crystallin family protein n=2 Tax=Hydrotalea TaxID=1004300 RepID=UPI001691133B|nr:Hsp20/alpha crystallin family protein [Hydrotalea sp.]MBY0347893.1 Hsp20/alpha crystallin family protein [Hydrotalea flava]NIM36233.1 Hsp20 family protein [Hydrotalea flava]NIM39084.1 Hsp20 family protein [Hydrotalea flava]NIN04319.1 Hsp20 family protein [Hydrotalea flava]NIN15945.1 Hsp20 family protein [Hydrotalea flava]